MEKMVNGLYEIEPAVLSRETDTRIKVGLSSSPNCAGGYRGEQELVCFMMRAFQLRLLGDPISPRWRPSQTCPVSAVELPRRMVRTDAFNQDDVADRDRCADARSLDMRATCTRFVPASAAFVVL